MPQLLNREMTTTCTMFAFSSDENRISDKNLDKHCDSFQKINYSSFPSLETPRKKLPTSILFCYQGASWQ